MLKIKEKEELKKYACYMSATKRSHGIVIVSLAISDGQVILTIHFQTAKTGYNQVFCISLYLQYLFQNIRVKVKITKYTEKKMYCILIVDYAF